MAPSGQASTHELFATHDTVGTEIAFFHHSALTGWILNGRVFEGGTRVAPVEADLPVWATLHAGAAAHAPVIVYGHNAVSASENGAGRACTGT